LETRANEDLLTIEQLATEAFEKAATVYFHIELIKRTIDLIGKNAETVVKDPFTVEKLTKILDSQVKELQKATDNL
jgi:hypothetical protein